MTLLAGAVLRWHTSATHPPKRKRFICAAPAHGWFLLINSRDVWGQSFLLPAGNCGGGLDHDSFVELRAVVRRDGGEVEAAIAAGQVDTLGALDRWALRHLQQAVQHSLTLPDEQIAVIGAAIAEVLSLP